MFKFYIYIFIIIIVIFLNLLYLLLMKSIIKQCIYNIKNINFKIV